MFKRKIDSTYIYIARERERERERERMRGTVVAKMLDCDILISEFEL